LHKPHSYSISDKNDRFLEKLGKKEGRSKSNALDMLIDSIRTGKVVQVHSHSNCEHGSIDPKTNMCRDCFKILN